MNEVIGIGGFVSRCRNDLVDTDEPGQYWVRTPNDLVGPFCGQRGCGRGDTCRTYRYEKPWQGNVSFHNAVPDVLAPVHHAGGSETAPILQSGTSFGVPVVAGVLATLRSDLAEHGSEPSPAELRHAIALGATDIDEGAVPKFDARQTRNRLRTDR